LFTEKGILLSIFAPSFPLDPKNRFAAKAAIIIQAYFSISPFDTFCLWYNFKKHPKMFFILVFFKSSEVDFPKRISTGLN